MSISNINSRGIKAEIELGLNSGHQQCERHSILMTGKCVKMDQDGKKKCQLTEDIMHEPKLHLWDVINPIESNEGRMTLGAWISHGWLSSIYQQAHGDYVTISELLAHSFISLMRFCNLSPQWPLLQNLVRAARSRLPFTSCNCEMLDAAEAWPLLFVGKLVKGGENPPKYASYCSWPNEFQ